MPLHLVELTLQEAPLLVVEDRPDLGLGDLAAWYITQLVVVLAELRGGLGLAEDQLDELLAAGRR